MDISIVPLHVAAHTQGKRFFVSFYLTSYAYLPVEYPATAYAIGELGTYSLFRLVVYERTGWLIIWMALRS